MKSLAAVNACPHKLADSLPQQKTSQLLYLEFYSSFTKETKIHFTVFTQAISQQGVTIELYFIVANMIVNVQENSTAWIQEQTYYCVSQSSLSSWYTESEHIPTAGGKKPQDQNGPTVENLFFPLASLLVHPLIVNSLVAKSGPEPQRDNR